jgi:hypothetical protein
VPITFLDGTTLDIEISSEMRCYEICEIIGTMMYLQSFLDYRLFLEDANKNCRVLDEEAALFKLLFPLPENL